jgi:hypothetical protein
LALRIAGLFHLIRGSASEAFKIGIGTPCDNQQDTGKHCEAKSGLGVIGGPWGCFGAMLIERR